MFLALRTAIYRTEKDSTSNIDIYPRLPPELIQHIFHFLSSDKHATLVAALVCRTWLYYARRETLLFSVAHITQDDKQYLNLVTSRHSTIPRFARRVYIHGFTKPSSYRDQAIFTLHKAGASPRSLHIKYQYNSCATKVWVPTAILTAFPLLTVIKVSVHCLPSGVLERAMGVICSLEHLEQFDLVIVGVERLLFNPETKLTLPPSLRRLSVENRPSQLLFPTLAEWFAQQRCRLTSLTLRIERIHIIHSFLEAFRDSVEHLDIQQGLEAIDLSKMFEMSTIRLFLELPHEEVAICQTLLTSPPNVLSRVIIRLYYRPRSLADVDALAFVPELRSVGELEVQLTYVGNLGEEEMGERIESVRSMLPAWVRRGALKVCVAPPI